MSAIIGDILYQPLSYPFRSLTKSTVFKVKIALCPGQKPKEIVHCYTHCIKCAPQWNIHRRLWIFYTFIIPIKTEDFGQKCWLYLKKNISIMKMCFYQQFLLLNLLKKMVSHNGIFTDNSWVFKLILLQLKQRDSFFRVFSVLAFSQMRLLSKMFLICTKCNNIKCL